LFCTGVGLSAVARTYRTVVQKPATQFDGWGGEDTNS